MAGVSCTLDANGEFTCGTGGWTGPKPGDPNTASMYLTATAAYGGIDVNWTYPDIFPEAVGFTTLYRSILPDPSSAVVLHPAVNGSFYYDRLENSENVVYYYWIRVTSIYGTKSDLIGPAWATAKPRIEQMIEELTGKIDSGVLAQSLKQEIDRIELNHLGITQEILDRQKNDASIGARVDVVGAHSGETRALLQQEVLARTSQGEAFVGTVNTLYAELNGNIAGVQQSTTAQITAINGRVDGLASQMTTLETEVNGNIAQAMQQMRTEIAVVDGKVVSIGALWTAQVNVNGLVGGFGVYNDGRIVEAGFDVDRFWVGRTNANKRKPFIIENNTTYIDDAAINKLTFNKLRDESGSFIVENGKIKADYIQVGTLVVNQAQSDNYVPGKSGWVLRANGELEFNGPSSGGGRLIMTNRLIQVFDANNVLRVRLGIWG